MLYGKEEEEEQVKKEKNKKYWGYIDRCWSYSFKQKT